MKGRFIRSAVLALLLGATSVAGLAAVAPRAACAAAAKSAKASKPRQAMHQFTGIVTAMDKSTLTVEKQGKAPRTVVFDRHAAMRTTGELEKNARVTVYYRDEGGRQVAHKVVVKEDKGGDAAEGATSVSR
jgi:hypothetical protein